MATILALAIAMAATGPIDVPAEHCRRVRGRYEIKADGDALWVVGSTHMLSVVVDALDRELRIRGWEDTVAYGDFTICTERPTDPGALTIRDVVRIKDYTNVTFVRRRNRNH